MVSLCDECDAGSMSAIGDVIKWWTTAVEECCEKKKSASCADVKDFKLDNDGPAFAVNEA